MPELINETEITKIDTTAKVEALQSQIAIVQSYKAFVSAKENERSISDDAVAYWDDVYKRTGDIHAKIYKDVIAINPAKYCQDRVKDAEFVLDGLSKQVLAATAKEAG